MTTSHYSRLIAYAGLLLVLAGTHELSAQTLDTGVINGTVVDSSGGVMPAVDLVLADPRRALRFTTTSGEIGQFTFRVPPSTYELSASKAGFAETKVSHLVIEVSIYRGVVVTMQPGHPATVVEVNAPTPALQTEGSQMGTSLGGEMLARLPGAKRDAGHFLQLQPGVAGPAGVNGGAVHGVRNDQSTYFLDGIDVSNNNDGGQNSLAGVIPVTQDSVEEFTINTVGSNASFARGAGGQVAMVGKRGSNAFHGALYEYNQNEALNANAWFNNKNGIAKAVQRDNRFGGALGGPILKDKTFFFANYEGRQQFQNSSANFLVPTDTLRQGILRFQDAAGNIDSFNLANYDPRGIGISPTMKALYALYPKGNSTAAGDGLNYTTFFGVWGAPVREDTGIARIDQVVSPAWRIQVNHTYYNYDWSRGGPAAITGKLVPTTETLIVGDVSGASLNGTLSPDLTSRTWYGFVRYRRTNLSAPPASQTFGAMNLPGISSSAGTVGIVVPSGILGNLVGGYGGTSYFNVRTHQISQAFSWTHGRHAVDFGGTFRYIPELFETESGDAASNSLLATIGTGNSVTVGSAYMPPTCTSTLTSNCLKSSDASNWGRLYAATLGLVDNVAYQGFRDSSLNPLPLGSRLLFKGSDRAVESYVVDTFKITPTLTLTYGLNYSVQPAPSVDNGQFVMPVDYSTGQPIRTMDYLSKRVSAASVGQIYNPIIAFEPLKNLGRTSLYDTTWSDIAPRASIAWSPGAHDGLAGKLLGDHKTVFRAGYGRYFDRVNQVVGFQWPAQSFGFADVRSVIGPACVMGASNCAAGTSALSAFRLGVDGSVPVPAANPLTAPLIPGNSAIPGANLAVQSITTGVDPDYKPAHTHSFNFSIERELPGGLVLETAAIGTWGRDLTQGFNMAAFPYMFRDAASGQTFAQAFDAVATARRNGQTPAQQPWFENQLPGISGGATNFLASNQSANFVSGDVYSVMNAVDARRIALGLAPYGVQTTQLNQFYARASAGLSSYRALQITVKRRARHGLMLDASYVLSRSRDTDGNNQNYREAVSNPFNFNQSDYGFSFFDRRHSVKGMFVYQVPSLKSGNAALRTIVNGWEITGIFMAYSGLPLKITQDVSSTGGVWGSGGGATTATWALPAGSLNSVDVGAHYGVGSNGINIFADPNGVRALYRPVLLSSDTYTGRLNPLRGFPFWNYDSSLIKRVTITERINLLASVEVFNLFNTVNFDNPSLALSNTTTFGAVTSVQTPADRAQASRGIQLGLRVEF